MSCSVRGNYSSCLAVSSTARADTETAVLLLEPDSVVNTGDAGGELTAEVEQLA
jgi:hypothetical protein